MIHVAATLSLAADNTTSADVVGTRLGMCGVEIRRIRGSSVRERPGAHADWRFVVSEEAHALAWFQGLPRRRAATRRLEFARRIAKVPNHGGAADT